MSIQTLDPILDIDFELDIEEELEDDDYAHALVFCFEHSEPKWHPVAGSIVQVVCGRILRSKGKEGNEHCDECLAVINSGKVLDCFVCGRKLV